MAKVSPEDQTLAYYDLNAKAYVARARKHWDREPLSAFSELVQKRKPQHEATPAKILDAGCGFGRDLEYFAENGFEAEGFDGSAEMVLLAQVSLLGKHTPVWQSDFRFLSLKREYYDGIWAMESLIHLPPVICLRVIQTFFSALKPGGVLFASFEMKGEMTGEISEEVAQREDRTDGPDGPARHIYSYPQSEFESLLRQNGLQPLMTGKSLGSDERRAVIAQRIL